MQFTDTVQQYMDANTRTPKWLQPLIQNESSISESLIHDVPRKAEVVVSSKTWTAVGKMLLQLSTKRSSTNAPSESVTINISLDAEKEKNEAPVEEHVVVEPPKPDSTNTVIDANAEQTPEGDTDASRRRKRKSFSDHQIEGERSSRRVRARAQEQSNTETTNDHEFFNEMDRLFEPLGVQFGDLAAASNEKAETSSHHDIPLRDFMANLNHLKDSVTKTFLRGEGIQNPAATATRLLDIAMTKPVTKELDILDETAGVEDFITVVNKGKSLPRDSSMFLSEAAVEWLNWFLLPREDGTELFLKYQWPSGLTKVVKRMATLYYDSMMYIIAESVKSSESSALKYASISQSYFELLLDDFIDCSQQQSAIASEKSHVSEYRERLCSWRLFTMDILSSVDSSKVDKTLWLRFEWATIIFEQAVGASHEDISVMFDTFRETINMFAAGIKIKLPNTGFIPDISAEALEIKKSQLDAASLFAGIFEASTNSQEPEEGIKLLEVVLKHNSQNQLPKIHVDVEVVQQFVGNSSTEFRLYLWTLLRQSYEATNDWIKAFESILIKLRLVMNDLKGDHYEKSDFSHRSFVLFKSLFLAGELLSKAAKLAMSDDKYMNSLSEEQIVSTFHVLVDLLRILHVYVLHEDGILAAGDAPSEHSIYNRCAVRFRAMLVQSWWYALLYL